MEGKYLPYFKPNGREHYSGFGTFEIGYVTLKEDKTVKDKIIIGEISDAIHLYDMFTQESPKMTSMDVTKDGYIRILDDRIKWRESPISDAWINLTNNN